MFSYQCEKCGMEVPPAYSECPNCKANAAQAAQTAAGVMTEASPAQAVPAPPYPQQHYPPQPYPPQPGLPPPQPPPQQPAQPSYYTPAGVPTGAAPPATPPRQMPPTVVGPPPPQPHAAPPYYAPPPPSHPQPQPRTGTPPWLVTLLVAVIFLLGGYVGYTQLLPKYRGSQTAPFEAPGTAAEQAPAAGAPHKLNKYLEVTGVRIIEEGRKPVVKFMLVNHSAAELTDINGVVELHTTAEKSGSGPIGQVPLKLNSIGAYESKEVSLPFATKLRAYEMPDWQFLRAELKEVSR